MTSINIPLAELNLDTLFVEQARRLGLATLGDILDSRLEALSKKRILLIPGMRICWSC